MRLEDRGRRAAAGVHRAVEPSDAPASDVVDRFHRFRARKQRNQRIGASLLGIAVTVVTIVALSRAFSPLDRQRPASPGAPGGLILYGDWDEKAERASWFTVRPDGSERHDLDIAATCAVWFPDGSRILITNDAAFGTGPLRPAVVDPSGSNLDPLDATKDPDLNLGCGDVSPDGSQLALEGFSQSGDPALNGIYTVRSADGGGLTQLLQGPVSPPRYSPDGSKLSFFDMKEGVSPSGSGALFVMDADRGDPLRITPWGHAFGDHGWSPDGNWIVFQRPYGQLYLVRPDGSDLHRVSLRLPPNAGALNPSWSPDGRWIVFSLQRSQTAEIHMVRPDGSGLRKVTGLPGAQLQNPDWGVTSP